MDIGLPKLNGYEACRVIRQQVWGSAVVIIALSGWGQDADRIRSRGAGFDRHMVKPVDPHELYTTINAVGDDRTEINDTLLCARRAVGDGK